MSVPNPARDTALTSPIDAVRSRVSQRGTRGFTLVELIVVVFIIAGLAALAVTLLLNQRDKADEGRLSSDATAAGRIMLTAASTGAAVTYTPTTVSTDASSASGEQSITVAGELTATFPSGSTPAAGDCIAITLPQSSMSYCLPDETGAGGGLQNGNAVSGGGGGTLVPMSLSYPNGSIPIGSNEHAITPSVTGADGAVSFSAVGTLPEGVAFNSSTGVITGPPLASWSFPPLDVAAVPGFAGAFAADSADESLFIAGVIAPNASATFGSHALDASASGDVYLARMNRAGVWNAVLPLGFNSTNFVPQRMSITESGDLVIVGSLSGTVTTPDGDSYTAPEGATSYLIVSVSSAGEVQWTRFVAATPTNTGTVEATLTDFTTTGDRSALSFRYVHASLTLNGTTYPPAGNPQRGLVLMLNRDGTTHWGSMITRNTISGGIYDVKLSPAPTGSLAVAATAYNASNVIFLGHTVTGSGSSSGANTNIFMVNSSGAVNWALRIANTASGADIWGRAVAVSPTGEMIVGLFQDSSARANATSLIYTPAASTDYPIANSNFAVKIDTTGVPAWLTVVSNSGSINTAVPTTSGGATILGASLWRSITPAGVLSTEEPTTLPNSTVISTRLPQGDYYYIRGGSTILRAGTTRNNETGILPLGFPTTITVTATDTNERTAETTVVLSQS